MRRRRSLHTCLYVFALLAVAACSRGFAIKPEGDQQSLTFHLTTLGDPERPTEFEITEFTVQQQADAGTWSTSWALSGEASLRSVKYGGSYRGLSATTPPAPLHTNVQYRALASANTPSAKGYASVLFHFDATGKLIIGTMSSP